MEKALTERVVPEIEYFGLYAIHNLTCWICLERPAVYDLYPHWIFRPCWECQKGISASRSWWYRFLEKRLRNAT